MISTDNRDHQNYPKSHFTGTIQSYHSIVTHGQKRYLLLGIIVPLNKSVDFYIFLHFLNSKTNYHLSNIVKIIFGDRKPSYPFCKPFINPFIPQTHHISWEFSFTKKGGFLGALEGIFLFLIIPSHKLHPNLWNIFGFRWKTVKIFAREVNYFKIPFFFGSPFILSLIIIQTSG